MSELVAHYSDDSYRFRTADGNATFDLDRIRVDRNGAIHAEVEIRWHVRPLDGLLKRSDLNLLADRSIRSWANDLEARIPDHDWYATLTAVASMSIDRFRQGDPPIILADVDPSERLPWFVEPFLQHGGPTVIAADGGTGKSLFALAFAALVASGHGKLLNITAPPAVPVLYLDWETDRFMHRDRLGAICTAAAIDIPRGIHYRREYAPLAESATELAKHVSKLQAGMVVVDSKGAALGGAPEDAESTIRLFRACRQLGVPVLVVDHITNEAADRGGAKRPFGSRYTRNLARNVWMMAKKAEQPGHITVAMKLTKSNDGPEGVQRAWQVYIERGADGRYRRIEFAHRDPQVVAALEPSSNVERIEQALRESGGPLLVSDLARITGLSPGSIRPELNAPHGRFARVNPTSEKEGLWVNAVRQMAQEDLPDAF